MANAGIYINGEWLQRGESRPNINPSEPEVNLGNYLWGNRDDIVTAAEAAHSALGKWKKFSPESRADILRTAGNYLLNRQEEIAIILSREQGKTLVESRAEVYRSVQIFHYYAGEAVRTYGVYARGMRSNTDVIVEREPLGVTALITPWNLPLSIPVWKCAAALAYGNCVIYKPSELTPEISVILVKALEFSGLPNGVLNMVMGSGRELGEELIKNSDGVTFTGSGATGAYVVAECAKRMVKVQAEMGGKSGLVIDKNSNLKLAVEVAFNGAFYGTGQRCTASSRIIVLDEIYEPFVDLLIARIKGASVGHALDENTEIGPVVDKNQLNKNFYYLDKALNEGAELLIGESATLDDANGYYFKPTLFYTENNKLKINQEEVFGPIATIQKADDLEHAIAIANDVEFALSSGIVTNDLNAANKFRTSSKAGMVTVNLPTAGLDFHVPFGGRSPSAYGAREQGFAAQEFYTEYKSTYTHINEDF